MKGERNGRKLAIVALSQVEMESIDRNHPFGKHIVISITCPNGEPEAKIRSDPKAILRLRFWDVAEPTKEFQRAFERKDAKSVMRFVEKNAKGINTIVIHCRAGVSRSVGMAAAIAKVMLGDDSVFYKNGRPNSRVYSNLMEEFSSKYNAGGSVE